MEGGEGKMVSDEVGHFMRILKHHQNAVFDDAKYKINRARQERLRLPTQDS